MGLGGSRICNLVNYTVFLCFFLCFLLFFFVFFSGFCPLVRNLAPSLARRHTLPRIQNCSERGTGLVLNVNKRLKEASTNQKRHNVNKRPGGDTSQPIKSVIMSTNIMTLHQKECNVMTLLLCCNVSATLRPDVTKLI